MTTEIKPEQWVTLTDCAKYLGVCKRTVERLIAAGEFPKPIKGKPARIPLPELVEYQERKKKERDTQ